LSLRTAILFSAIVHLFFSVVLLRGEFLSKPRYTPTPLVARIIIPEEKPYPIKKTMPQKEKNKQVHKIPSEAKKKTIPSTPPLKPKKEKPASAKESPKKAPPEMRPRKEPSGVKTEKEEGLNKTPSSINKTDMPETLPLPAMPSGKQLIDERIIEKMAKKSLKQTQKPSTGITFDASELKYKPYLQKLKERIESIWIYPPEAAAKGIYGDLYIRFTIKKNGHLGSVELLRTSGYRELDEAALQALRDGEPYWPLPDSWGMDAITITGHFIYTIYGVYIR